MSKHTEEFLSLSRQEKREDYDTLREQNATLLTGHEHIIMHTVDRCDCGRSYGDIARAAIAAAKGEA